MSFKIISLDIDGTLTNSEKKITEMTRKKLFEFQENGGKVILASGRPTMGIKPYADILRLSEYEGYILAFNGGRAIDCKSGKIMFEKTLPEHVIPDI